MFNPGVLFVWTTVVALLNTHLNRGIDIDKRVLEYNVFASCKYDCPVVSFVI